MVPDPMVAFKNRLLELTHTVENMADFYTACDKALFLLEVSEDLFVGFDYCYKASEIAGLYRGRIDALLRDFPHHAVEKKLQTYRQRFCVLMVKYHRLQQNVCC